MMTTPTLVPSPPEATSPGAVPKPPVPAAPARTPFLPPRWVVRAFWVLHRAAYRLTGGRRGLWRPKAGGWGTLVLRTVGRHSGREREAIVGYLEDGPNLVTLAMNGWAAPEPAWWLNLQARPEATVELRRPDGTNRTIRVRGRAAVGEERERLWQRYRDAGDSPDQYTSRRGRETAVVVLEPIAPS